MVLPKDVIFDGLHDMTFDDCQFLKLAEVLASARGHGLSLGRGRRESASFDVWPNFSEGRIGLLG